MKSRVLFFLLIFLSYHANSQEEFTDETCQLYLDSIESTLVFEKGTIQLANGVAKITIPKGFKYLSGKQAEYILYDLWGNPKDDSKSYGFILRENQHVMDDNSYIFNIEYDEMGYVEDDDAEDLDYDDLMKDLQKDEVEENKIRVKNGYEPAYFIGWASTPYYDRNKKVLHWAKEIKFGDSEENTLNYNVRILGRKGVLILNAIAVMSQLGQVKKDIPSVLTMVKYNPGYKYEEFDSSNDHVAEWTIGGLVAGKVLAKVGFFALLIKFWKIVVLAIAGAVVVIRRFLTGRGAKKEEIIEPLNSRETPKSLDE